MRHLTSRYAAHRAQRGNTGMTDTTPANVGLDDLTTTTPVLPARHDVPEGVDCRGRTQP
ncbi:hypothetical protein LZG04_10675 [Saccharothrix sp. S26]|uniref:hypothetical protein n=1 Tax=Saccharothrix sp. S26 TaxID=2907215 RepID=UPI001F36A7D4|nr:hypothetical protein [Saccharothrix sp. S26]MCE6995271.1 hypothetical protein [Saccharothrix sp. S26]